MIKIITFIYSDEHQDVNIGTYNTVVTEKKIQRMEYNYS